MEQKYEQKESLFKAIAITGLITGTLDITGACIHAGIRGVSPLAVLRYVASGVFGKDAFTGGVPMALAGLGFHYIIAFCWTTLFFLIYPQIARLSNNKIITSVLIGALIWVMMSQVILPMTNIPKPGSFNPVQALIGAVILMICIGLPVSFRASAFYSKR